MDDFISLFSRLPAGQRVQVETRFLTTLAHGIHMLAYVAPSDNALRQLSAHAARISGIVACDGYKIGDFDRLAKAAPPDPEAAQNAQFVLNVLHWLSGLLPD